MKLKILDTLLVLVFISLCSKVLAQKNIPRPSDITYYDKELVQEAVDSLKENLPSFELTNEYVNKVVFWGRDFGRPQFGFEPGVIFKTGTGLYINASNHYWSAMENVLSKTDIGIGYEKQVTEKLYISFGYEYWTFYYRDKFFRNALKHLFEAEISYEILGFNFEPAVYYMFGSQSIFQADFSLNREFFLTELFTTGNLSIKPSATSIFASENFLPLYSYTNINYGNGHAVKLVDYQFSLPLNLKIRNFELEPALHYNIPVALTNEVIDPYYFFSVRLSYNIYMDNGRIRDLYNKLR